MKFVLSLLLMLAGLEVGECRTEAMTAPRQVLEILESVQFRVTGKVSDIPQSALIRAGAIGNDEKLETQITDIRQRFNPGDVVRRGYIMRLLNFGGISDHYLVLCYLKGGYGLSCNLLLIGGLDTTPRILFRASLFGECKTLDDVKERLRVGQFQVLEDMRHL